MSTSFPQYEKTCGWNALLPPRQAHPSLAADESVDVAIIGAGYTGLAAARRLSEIEPSKKIAVLESSSVGEGNPGRNSGFLLEISLADDADPHSIDRMQTCNELIAATMRDIVELTKRHDIQCNLARSGTYRAAAGEYGRRALDQYRQFLDGAGLPVEVLDQDDIEARIGTRFYTAGLYSPHCYLAQPAALIRGIADALPPAATVYENTPALAIDKAANGWRVRTSRGTLRCRQLIVANNAFASSLGLCRSRLAKIYTYAGLTDPLPEEKLAVLGTSKAWGILPAHRLGSTLRRTADGRLLIRSCYDYERESDNASIAEKLTARLERRFPSLAPLSLAHVWGGATGYTHNGGPVWGEMSPGLFVSAGCNGGGVVKGSLFGRLLAELACGGVPERDLPDVHALFGQPGWMPPEPLRGIGFRLLSARERRLGASEI